MDGDLPKAFGKVHGAEKFGLLQALDGILYSRERKNHLVTALIHFLKIREKPPVAVLLLDQQDRSSIWTR